jgi:hypothetical protein
MNSLHKAFDDFWFARVFAFVFADLAGIVVEVPAFGNFCCYELDNYVHWFHTLEVVCEMGANAK